MKKLAVVTILFILMTSSTAAETSKSLTVGYVIAGANPSGEDDAVLLWLRGQKNITPVEIKPSFIKESISESRIDILWVHCPDRESFDSLLKSGAVSDIGAYLKNKIPLLLTDFAALIPATIKIETNAPEVRTIDITDEGFGRKYGFHSFLGHPLFDGLFGGTYVWDGYEDIKEPRIGYFEDKWPKEGKTLAVEKGYITLYQDNKLIIEHTVGDTLCFSIGAFIHFSPKNRLAENTRRLLLNAFDYLSSPPQSERQNYWKKSENKTAKFNPPAFPPFSPSVGRTIEGTENAGFILKREPATDNFFDLAGRRCLVMGKEKGGIDEVWVHPFRLLKDLEIGLLAGPSVKWLSDFPAGIEIMPEAIVRTYKTPYGKVIERLISSPDEPGGIINISCESSKEIKLLIRLKSDLRLMWPYRENTLGGLNYGYSSDLNAFIVKSSYGGAVGIFGADIKPVMELYGQYNDISYKKGKLYGAPVIENIVSFAAVYCLNNKNSSTLNFIFAGSNKDADGWTDAEKTYRHLTENPMEVHRLNVQHYKRLLDNSVEFISPDSKFNELFKWAVIGTDRMIAETPGLGTALLAGLGTTARGWDGGHKINGRPGYAWYFGRDAAWCGFAIDNYGDFETVRMQLEFFAAFQDPQGKIFHELTTSGCVHYDAADSTPLYVILAAHYLRSSGDAETISRLWDSIKKALDFLYSTDTDGDGLIENTGVGHGWIEGGKLYGAHTSLYLAGLWSEALDSAAYIAGVIGENSLAEKYLQNARTIRNIINWNFYNDVTDFYNLGLWQGGSYNAEKTIMPAVPMAFSLLNRSRVSTMLDEWASNGFSSDWGVRILSSESPLYNPRGYHYGSVWPLFTGWAALAEYEYGNSVQGFAHVMNNMLIKENWALGFVEEVLDGEVYRPSGVCPHQGWSETNIIHPLITGMLGFKPDAVNSLVELRPRFPLNWDSVTVKKLRTGASIFEFSMKRGGSTTEYHFKLLSGPALKVHLAPELPEGMRISSSIINGAEQSERRRDSAGLLQPPLEFTLDGDTAIDIKHSGGIGAVPYICNPRPGEKSLGYRIIKTALNADIFSMTVEGKSGTSAVFQVRLFDGSISRTEGAVLQGISLNGIADLLVTFNISEKPYQRKTIKLELE